MKAEIIYLYHSAFAVRTPSHFLVFDYYYDRPQGGGLAQGVISPEEIRGENVVVFASHRHPDHYSPRILSWRSQIPDIRYVLSDGIRTRGEVLAAAPGRNYDLGDLRIRTLKSTDEGVAFLTEVDGMKIYHAGDLNWWKWDGDSEEEAAQMEREFKGQVDLLRGETVDAAFLPCDPRQCENSVLGFDYFMRTVCPRRAVPMHSFGNTGFFKRLDTDPRTEPYRKKILQYRSRGETMVLTD